MVEVGEEAATEGPRRQDQQSEPKAQRQLVLSSWEASVTLPVAQASDCSCLRRTVTPLTPSPSTLHANSLRQALILTNIVPSFFSAITGRFDWDAEFIILSLAHLFKTHIAEKSERTVPKCWVVVELWMTFFFLLGVKSESVSPSVVSYSLPRHEL